MVQTFPPSFVDSNKGFADEAVESERVSESQQTKGNNRKLITQLKGKSVFPIDLKLALRENASSLSFWSERDSCEKVHQPRFRIHKPQQVGLREKAS